MRRKKEEETEEIIEATPSALQFFSSGCTPLDLVLGGGYPLGRISNIVGDKSTAKTGLIIEASANFNISYPEGDVHYVEAESAFDIPYAKTMGLPEKTIITSDITTVEGLFNYISNIIKEYKNKNIPTLCAVDSLDALSDEEEMGREINKGSYGANKAKKLSEMFRRLTKDIDSSNICLLIVSQTRDKIGAMFGEKHSRSGGRALDFYASLIVWLSEVEKITKQSKGVKRITGIKVKAYCKKNKISKPFRACEFPYMFGYGIDNIQAGIEFLESVKINIEELGFDKEFMKNVYSGKELEKRLDEQVIKHWREIEAQFDFGHNKYV